MGRLLLWILLGALVYAMIKGLGRANAARVNRRASEAMVKCETCGLNVPQSEGFSRAGHWYCSREHLDSGGGAG
jgi:hypothetical protein